MAGSDKQRDAPAAAASKPSQPPASFDAELDALFTQAKPAQAVPSKAAAASTATEVATVPKRKRDDAETKAERKAEKRARAAQAELAAAEAKKQRKEEASSDSGEDGEDDSEEEEDEDEASEDDDASLDMSEIEREIAEQGLTRGDDEDEELLDEEDEDEGEEEEAEADEASSEEEEVAASSDEEISEDDADAKPPVHESLANSRQQQRIRKKLEQRELESKEVRDKRSIFLANIPIACVQSKTLTKALKRHIVALSPYPSVTRVESVRYRSVAFAVPTADYAAESGADAASNEKRRARARSFKDAVDAGEDGDVAKNGKPYLNAKQKRKVAYINHEINDKAKAVNAYFTLDNLTERDIEKLNSLPGSSTARSGNLTAPILAALTAAQVDDSLFEGRHLRADLAVPLTLPELVSAGLDRVVSSPSTSDILTRILTGGGKSKDDQSRTLFVGNLDFEADEEDLRAMLEAVVREERGTPPSSSGPLGKEIGSLPPFEAATTESEAFVEATWVHSVRIIRDAATQMGKGFAYVNFLDEVCVDELMAIWEADEAFLSAGRPGSRSKDDGKREDGSRKEFKRRLKLNKRPLRLARCKNTSGGKGQKSASAAKKSTQSNGEGEASTPKKKADNRRRSMGAPTPDGTSPSAISKKAKVAHSSDSPSRPPPVATGSSASGSASKFPSSSSTLIPNPPPKFARTEADLARMALKRNDPDRQAKRMAKKERKKQELKMGSRAGGGAKDKVDLKIGKKAKTGKSGSGFKGAPKKGGAAGIKAKGKGKK
ncbi:hypothetical protein BCV69DRAFT_282091 [Microstroma glucosiphilum]|uniref:RRM domain-containing protein n=1 Tax=Pseudomicrostroma glucosiphilum TaxID=1684307 RepID=A0A316U7Z2_9BASI|nr:hypothetical protein BCV69DRAFT_282091 [Pseudomicrostroma glucosiphilum]PWN21357.1 hypothetical protein BCV69DRAFT_282091 [Pseudomicrostroma glucosiphilum]